MRWCLRSAPAPSDERAHYPDVDLVYEKRGGKIRFTNKAGEAYD